jgi:hypothetical protein
MQIAIENQRAHGTAFKQKRLEDGTPGEIPGLRD